MRVRARLTAISAAAAIAASLLIVGPAAAVSPPGYTCSGTLGVPGVIAAGTYGRLTMPAGSACEINGPGGVTVLRPMSLGSGAALLVNAGSLTVRGGMTVGKNALFIADALGPSENAPVTIDGPVTVLSHGGFVLGQEVPYGPVFARINGSVTGFDAAAVVIQNVRIGGGVTILGGGGDNPVIVAFSGSGMSYNDFEDDQIHGALAEVGYKGIWAGIIRSKIWGPMIFARNVEAMADEYDIGSNIIHGFVYCADNNPNPNMGHSSGSPSIVYGPTFGNQASTCTGTLRGGTGPTP